MCGIAGIAHQNPERPVSAGDLEVMVRTLRHRGPDDAGQVALPGAGLGMRRLSIIDVAGGRQPFASEDGAVHLVGNGEIYNHRALRAELASAGHVFGSASDIEVALHGYEQWGPAFVERLHGMFSLALWDAVADAVRGARPGGREAPLLRSLGARPAPGLRDQGAARRARRVAGGGPRRPRPVPDLRVRDHAAHDLRGGPAPPRGPLPGLSAGT